MSVASSALVWAHSTATGTQRLVLLAIADHDGEGGAWPSVERLARWSAVGDRAVQKAIRALEALGELEVLPRAGGLSTTPDHMRPNLYRIVLACPPTCDGTAQHRPRPVDNTPRPTVHPLSDGTGAPPSHGSPLPPSHGSPEPSIEPVQEPSPQPPADSGVPEALARLWEGEGISDDERSALWASLVADPETLIPTRRGAQAAWYVPAVAAIRAKTLKETGSAVEQLRKYGPDCDHGTPGGAAPHPLTGLPLCPTCRYLHVNAITPED